MKTLMVLIVGLLFSTPLLAEKYIKKAPMSPGLVEGIGTSRAAALRAAVRNIPTGYERDLKQDLVYKCVRESKDGRCYTFRYTIHVAKKGPEEKAK